MTTIYPSETLESLRHQLNRVRTEIGWIRHDRENHGPMHDKEWAELQEKRQRLEAEIKELKGE